MKRRDFLKSTLPAASLAHVGFQTAPSEARTKESVSEGYDLIVVGGTLAGCFAAMHAARNGLKVLLVERRTFLATEITAPLRPWLRRDGYAKLTPKLREFFLPDAEQNEVRVPFDPEASSSVFGDDVPLLAGSVKKQFMQGLLEENVHVLVGTGVCGVLANGDQKVASGLVLASKFGLHVAKAKRIIDASLSDSAPTSPQVAYTVEVYGVAKDTDSEIDVPESLDLLDNMVMLHRGKRKPGQCFLEFRFKPAQDDVEHEARLRTESVFAHLVKKHKGFAKVTIVQLAWQTTGGERTSGSQPYANYVQLPSEAAFDLSCQDIIDVEAKARECIDERSKPATDARAEFVVIESGSIPVGECRMEPHDDPGSDYLLEKITLPVQRLLPAELRADVVVAGGGTAGAMAALGSVQEGARTITVEYLPDLGGTSTIGRVTGYYWGYKETRFFKTINDDVSAQGRLAGRCTKAVARMLHYRKQATQAGGTLLTGAITCGVVKDGQKVKGLLVERAGRLFAIEADVVIDATGDGDVAAFAGADYEVGNHRMQCTQNYSQWDVNAGVKSWEGSSTNRDHDILWSHLLSEWQRGYQLTHQQAHYYDFTPFLTVRECRRVVGDYTISLRDVVLGRRHADAICLANSDFDPHYFGDTAFTRAGCLLPHGFSAVVEIPYRAILPRGQEGLLISAKAISQTHNALQFTRMSFDIMTLGYVTGRIAAMCVRTGIAPRQFDVSSLQGDLRELKILSEASAPSKTPVAESVAQHVADLREGKPESLLRITMHSAQTAEPALREAFKSTESASQKLGLAKALAWFGDPAGNKFIAEEMKALFQKEQAEGKLPREYYREDKATSYWTINQDIALLGMSGDPAVLPEILALADALELDNPPVVQKTKYNQGRIDLRLIPYYNRIVNLCFAIERLPDATANATLNRFLDDRFICGCVSRTREEAGDKIYGGILESRLAATLARCGSKRGLSILAAYLDDVHPMLVSYARQELAAILKEDFGEDCAKWKTCIDGLPKQGTPTPRETTLAEW